MTEIELKISDLIEKVRFLEDKVSNLTNDFEVVTSLVIKHYGNRYVANLILKSINK